MRFLSVLLLLGVSLMFARCEVYEDLDVEEVEGVQIGKIANGVLDLKITASIVNPNPYGIKLKETDLEVYLDDNFMGTAHLNDPVKLLRKQTKSYTFDVQVAIEKGAMAKMLVLSLKQELSLKVKGNIKASVMGINKTLAVSKTKNIGSSILRQK